MRDTADNPKKYKIDSALDIDSDDGQVICWLCPQKFSDFSEAKIHFEDTHAWEHLTESIEEEIFENEEEHNEINEEAASNVSINLVEQGLSSFFAKCLPF